MLTESTYHLALYVYLGAAGLMVLYTTWWLSRSWRPFWVALVVLLMAVLLLTPAYPEAGVDTMAPALVVVAFQVLTGGIESAQHAIRPLVVMGGAAVVVALLLQVVLFRKLKSRRARQQKPPARATGKAAS